MPLTGTARGAILELSEYRVGHPLQRLSCRSRLFPGTCPECRRPVYVYSCSCHSGVRLEENQPPWTKHDCYAAALKRAQEREEAQQKKKYSEVRLIKKADYEKMQEEKRRSAASSHPD